MDLTVKASGDGDAASGTEMVGAEPSSCSSTYEWAARALARMDDPVSDLPPTARRVLAGALRVVVTKGFAKLTLASISTASAENVAAVKYYFGNKAGLVRVMVDAVVYDEIKLLVSPPGKHPEADGLSWLVQDTFILSEPGKPSRVLFELVPHALRDKKLRQRLQEYYETFYELHLEQLGAGEGGDAELRSRLGGLAILLAAVSDGLTMQALVAPEHFDMMTALRALDALFAGGIPALVGSEANES